MTSDLEFIRSLRTQNVKKLTLQLNQSVSMKPTGHDDDGQIVNFHKVFMSLCNTKQEIGEGFEFTVSGSLFKNHEIFTRFKKLKLIN